MAKSVSDKHYEEKFEFPLWKLIKQRAEEKDISYVDATAEVVPEYVKTIKYRDEEFEREAINKRAKELEELYKRDGLSASKVRELVEEYERERGQK